MALDLPAFGQLVRERRQRAGLTQAKLAKLTGLTEVTIRNIEYAHNPASEDTLRRLLEVPQLEIAPGDIPTIRRMDLENDLEFFRKLNWFIAPDYEVLKLWLDLRKQMNSEAGRIEQTYLYLDAESAADYLLMASNYEREGLLRDGGPFSVIANAIISHLPNSYLDVVVLGPGDAGLETRLVQRLMTLRPDLLLKLYLLDISQPMLNIGYRHAADALGEYPNVFIAGMQGNFHDLPCYQHLFYAPKSRPTCRVFVMIGGTMNNIDNELRFCRHSLATAAVGDLLLLSVQCAHTEQLNDAAIRRAEPAMQKPFPALHAKWLSTPIRHYCDDASDIQFRNVVRLDCIIPGSYAIDAVARVRFKDGRSRDISMCRFKRYNSEKFAESLRTEGWERIEEQSVRLTDEQSVKASFMLFRKVAMPENGLDPTADAAPSGPKS